MGLFLFPGFAQLGPICAFCCRELSRLAGRFRSSLALLRLIVIASAAGQVLLEGMGWIEAECMTVFTLATVCVGAVRPLSTTGRILTLGLILLAVVGPED